MNFTVLDLQSLISRGPYASQSNVWLPYTMIIDGSPVNLRHWIYAN